MPKANISASELTRLKPSRRIKVRPEYKRAIRLIKGANIKVKMKRAPKTTKMTAKNCHSSTKVK